MDEGETLEQENPLEREEMLERKALEPLEPPTKEELRALKKALGLTHGSLQHKKRGDGVYHVVWNKETKKHEWTHLGSWDDLKKRLDGI